MEEKIGNTDIKWAEEVLGKIYNKTKASAKRSIGKIPYLTEKGIFDDWSDRIGWWTNGFYAGQLWLLYNVYGDELFKDSAEDIERKLDACLIDYDCMDHDNGFKWIFTSGYNYKINENRESRNRALLAASNLAGRFNPSGRFIRAWNDGGTGENSGWAIIDCMMNLPLLYWASNELNDARFKHIAMAHADTVIKAFVRSDGSVHHIVMFDDETGNVIGVRGGQGKDIGTSWTRGQSWAIYGFAQSYRYTHKLEYLETAKKVAKYFAENIPSDSLIPVDFYQDKELEWEDSTAAAIAACGMLEIEKYVDDGEKVFYHENALRLLKALNEKRSNWEISVDNILENCTAAYNDENHNFSIIYGDYYFTEALLKICGKDIII